MTDLSKEILANSSYLRQAFKAEAAYLEASDTLEAAKADMALLRVSIKVTQHQGTDASLLLNAETELSALLNDLTQATDAAFNTFIELARS